MSIQCEDCEWYRYPILVENTLRNKPITPVVTDLRRCERGWCDKEEQSGKKR